MIAGCGAYMNAWMHRPMVIAATMISGFLVSIIGKAKKPQRRGEHRADQVHGLAADAVGEPPDRRDHDHVHDVGDQQGQQDLACPAECTASGT